MTIVAALIRIAFAAIATKSLAERRILWMTIVEEVKWVGIEEEGNSCINRN